MDLIAFVPATDLDRARMFYEGTLGLAFESESPFACVFRAGGTMLRVTKVDTLTPQPFTVLGWAVADIGKEVRDLTSAGVRFARFDGMDQDELGVWTTPDGSKVAWFTDPDGNTLSLTEFHQPAAAG
jgi:predicted enzyme related to lactoylglutathione lyase